jgi:mannose-6-phosphate isomerase-like protein (cupin superfamily)
MTHPNVTEASRGDTFDLGTITLRRLAGAEQSNGAYALGEFSGGEGPWTVPHMHQQTEESFYVLDGSFTFTLGTEEVQARPGSFILVPRGMRHELRAAPGGGRLLTLWVPGQLEAMFVELSRMPPGSLRDPEARKAISARFDSIPA